MTILMALRNKGMTKEVLIEVPDMKDRGLGLTQTQAMIDLTQDHVQDMIIMITLIEVRGMTVRARGMTGRDMTLTRDMTTLLVITLVGRHQRRRHQNPENKIGIPLRRRPLLRGTDGIKRRKGLPKAITPTKLL